MIIRNLASKVNIAIFVEIEERPLAVIETRCKGSSSIRSCLLFLDLPLQGARL